MSPNDTPEGKPGKDPGKRPTLERVKRSAYKSISKMKKLVALAEGIIGKPYSTDHLVTAGSYKNVLDRHVQYLERMPVVLDNLMSTNSLLNESPDGLAAKRAELTMHIHQHKYQQVMNEAKLLQANINSWLKRDSTVEKVSTSKKSIDSCCQEECIKNGSAIQEHMPSENACKIVESMNQQVKQMQHNQEYLIASVNSLQAFCVGSNDRQQLWNTSITNEIRWLHVMQQNTEYRIESALEAIRLQIGEIMKPKVEGENVLQGGETAHFNRDYSLRTNNNNSMNGHLSHKAGNNGNKNSKNGRGRSHIYCLYCANSEHISRNCHRSVSERISIAKERGRCEKCLSPKHVSCQIIQNCHWCGENHHSWHCPARYCAEPETLTMGKTDDGKLTELFPKDGDNTSKTE